MTSNLIRKVATPAPERQAKTQAEAEKAIRNAMPLAQQYGVKINQQMEKVSGRVLDGPKLEYAGAQVCFV